jgi:hypothetical protein
MRLIVSGGVGFIALSFFTPIVYAAPEYLAPNTARTGTETIYCTSGWMPQQGGAEADCNNTLANEESSLVTRLSSEGKRQIGGVTYPLDCTERDASGGVEFQCTGRREISWIQEVRAEAGLSLVNHLSGRLTAGRDKSAIALFAEDPSLPHKSQKGIVDLDAELEKRFRARFGNNFHTMTLKNVAILASDVAIGSKISSLPTTISEENYVARNDTDSTQNRKFRITVTTREGERYSFERTLVRGSTQSTNLGFNVKGISGGVTTGLNRQLTIRNSSENSFEETRAYEEQFEQNVRPRTAMFIKVTRETSNDVYALTGSILFEAEIDVQYRWKDVYACGIFNTDRCSRWKTRIETHKLSQVVPEAERKFDMSGLVTISSSANSSTTISYAERPLSSLSETLKDEIAPEKFNPVIPEKDYIQVTNVPAGLNWRKVGTQVTCGFWIFRRPC